MEAVNFIFTVLVITLLVLGEKLAKNRKYIPSMYFLYGSAAISFVAFIIRIASGI